MSEKQALRRDLLALRNSLLPGDRQSRDAAICRAVAGHAWFAQAETVLAYYPIGSEPDIRPALDRKSTRLNSSH